MWQECKKIQSEIVKMRQELHQIPEVGGTLPKTQSYIINKLKKMGISFKKNKKDSGLCAMIHGGKAGKTIAFRTDMDALPIKEENSVFYASRHEGYMHACGHDAHMAMMLGAMQVLNENREALSGNIKIIFQTDEESAKGAERSIEEGALDGVEAIFGMHIGTILSKNIPSGTMICPSGCCMASFDKFVIKVKGSGCHGSTPEKGIDPINIAAHIIINLQEIIAREIPTVKPAVLTVGHLESGYAYNVIPSEAIIEGTIRAVDEEIRKKMAKRIGEIARLTAEAFRGEVEYEMIWGAPPVVNDGKMAEMVCECAKEILGKDMVIHKIEAPSMIGEDFSYYLNKVLGAFLFLSSSNAEKHTDIAHHSSKFNIDEDVLWIGSAMFVKIAEQLLGNK